MMTKEEEQKSKTVAVIKMNESEAEQQQKQQIVVVGDNSGFPKLCCKTTEISGLSSHYNPHHKQQLQRPPTMVKQSFSNYHHHDDHKTMVARNNSNLLPLNLWTTKIAPICKSRLISKLEKTPPKEAVKSLPNSPSGNSRREFERRFKETLEKLDHFKDDDDDKDEHDYDPQDQYEKLRPMWKGKESEKQWKFVPRYYNDIMDDGKDDEPDNDDNDDDQEAWLKDLVRLVMHSSTDQQPKAQPIVWLRSSQPKSANKSLLKQTKSAPKIIITPIQGEEKMMNFDRQTTTTNPNLTTAVIRGTFSRASTLTAMVVSSNQNNDNNNLANQSSRLMNKGQWSPMNQAPPLNNAYNLIADFFRRSSPSRRRRRRQQRQQKQQQQPNDGIPMDRKQQRNNYRGNYRRFNSY